MFIQTGFPFCDKPVLRRREPNFSCKFFLSWHVFLLSVMLEVEFPLVLSKLTFTGSGLKAVVVSVSKPHTAGTLLRLFSMQASPASPACSSLQIELTHRLSCLKTVFEFLSRQFQAVMNRKFSFAIRHVDPGTLFN